MDLTNIFGKSAGDMKFTITVRCASGHTQVVTRSWPVAECAEVFAQEVARTGKCGICGTPLEAHIAAGQPAPSERSIPMEFN